MPVDKSGYELAAMLSSIHTHAELCKPDSIVYREQDIIRFLENLGYPKPDFDALNKANKFWKGNRPTKDNI